MSVAGFDVSAANGTIDWPELGRTRPQHGRSFVIVKATEGAGYVDPTFQRNWAGAKSAGLVRGVYEFAHLDTSPILSAEHTCGVMLTAGYDDTDLPPALDVERVKGSPTGLGAVAWILSWCERAMSLTGRRPIVYTGAGYWGQIGNPDTIDLAAYDLWLAAYVQNPDRYVPPPWHIVGWTIHQESGDVAAPGGSILHLPGMHGNVDSNVLRPGRTIEDLVIDSHLARTDPAPAEPGLQLGDDAAVTTIADEVNRSR